MAGMLHAAWVPVGEAGYQNAADEAAHVNFIRILATGHLPTRQDAEADPLKRSYEWHQPPLYYGLAALAVRTGDRGLRTVSLLMGLVAILLIYRTCHLLFPAEPGIAVLAAGVAALLPGHVAVTSTVNNDGLLEVFCSATLLALTILLRNGTSQWRAGWLGIVLGGALLTKATGLLLLPVILFALILLRRSGEPWSAVLKCAAWAFGIAFVICGWWYVRNMQIYHEWLPLHAFQESFRGTAQAADLARLWGGWGSYWQHTLSMSFDSFWAVYGTPLLAHGVPGRIAAGSPGYLPAPVYQLMALVSLCVVGGMVRLHFKRREFTAVQRYALWMMLLLLLLVATAFAGFLARYFQAQGRYLYPAMLPICLCIALGWRAIFPERYRDLAGGLLLGLLGLMLMIFLVAVQAVTMG
jgi:4-amino-4-deoxy-L-arabinose transferase-like glycosyltransferase